MSKEGDYKIELSKLQPYPELLRSVDRDDEVYKNFAAAVKQYGVLEPIQITPIPTDKVVEGGPTHWIVNGLQRFSASQDAGFIDIPARIVSFSPSEVRIAQIIANVQRIETKPKEYAQALAKMLADDPMLTKQDLADRLNVGLSWFDKILSVRNLNDEVGELVDTGKITLANAITLAKLKPEDQTLFANDAMTKDNATLGASVQSHISEQKKALREGRPAGPVEFQPKAKFIKLDEIQNYISDDNVISAFLTSSGLKANKDSVAAAKMAFLRTISLDPTSAQAQKDQHEADKKKREELAATKKAEREKNQGAANQEARAALESQLAGVAS